MTTTETFITILLILFVVLSLAFIIAVSFLVLVLDIFPVMFRGAFFASSGKDTVKKMVLLSRAKPGDKAVDLGSGDGRLVIALAKAGAEAHGYEINPILVWWSKRQIKKAGLSGKAFVSCKNFWNLDLSSFNIITVFGIGYMMARLESKLKKELKPGAKIISKYFTFPNWQHSKKEASIYVYEK